MSVTTDDINFRDNAPMYAPFFGCLGALASISLSAVGAAFGTAKCMIGTADIAYKKPGLIIKSLVPVVMAGVIGIYGLVAAIMIAGKIDKPPKYTLQMSFAQLSGGFCVGICGLAAGVSIGWLGEWGVRSTAIRPQMYMTTVLMTGFAMVLGIYGLIVALLQNSAE